MDWSDMTGYWLGDEENRVALEVEAAPVPDFSGMFFAPEEVDPRKLFPSHRFVEHQGSQGSCAGHANTSILELCLGIATQSEPVHLSRQYSYVCAQKKSGISGDRGSTIHGNVEVAREGIPEEQYWPYTGKYVTSPPGGWEPARQNAQKYRLAQHSVLKTYQQVFDWIASGTGGVNIGIRWSLPDAGVCESYRDSGGGHAVALVGYTTRKEIASGRNYLLLLNSWGTAWGAGGWCEVAPRAIEQMLGSSYAVFIGMSDMIDIAPRPIDFTGRLRQ